MTAKRKELHLHGDLHDECYACQMVLLAKQNGAEERREALDAARQEQQRREAAVLQSIEAQEQASDALRRKGEAQVRQVEFDKILQRIEDRAGMGYRNLEYALCGKEWAGRIKNPQWTSMNDADYWVDVTSRQTEQLVQQLRSQGFSIHFERSNCHHFWSLFSYRLDVDLTIQW